MNTAEAVSRLTPGTLERAVDGVLADAVPVFEHVLSDPAYRHQRTLDALADCLRRHTFPPLALVSKVVGWTVFELQWRARYQSLTAEEQALLDAARRLWDALDGVSLD